MSSRRDAPVTVRTRARRIAVVALAWGVVHSLTGLAAHRLDVHRLAHDGRLLRPRGFEVGGRWYRQRLHIDRWKDALPEAGDLFPGGVSKRHVVDLDDVGLERFVQETRRAELGHWWAMACGPLFVLWTPRRAWAPLISYGVVVNAPFIAVQRYNRFRTQAILEHRARRRPGR